MPLSVYHEVAHSISRLLSTKSWLWPFSFIQANCFPLTLSTHELQLLSLFTPIHMSYRHYEGFQTSCFSFFISLGYMLPILMCIPYLLTSYWSLPCANFKRLLPLCQQLVFTSLTCWLN